MRDLGIMTKYNVLQYYTTTRVMQIVGPDGITPQVFDYDPASLVPSHLPGEDPDKPSAADRIQRARTFADNLEFFILPNSLHELTQTTIKLGLIQLKKAGIKIDSQTIAEAWNVPSYGTIPGSTVIEKYQNEQEIDLAFAARMKQEAGAEGLLPPQPPANPVGRPPSGQQSPQMEQKDGGTRTTVTESPK